MPTGRPLSTFHPGTYSAAYVEFQFGDACPFLDPYFPNTNGDQCLSEYLGMKEDGRGIKRPLKIKFSDCEYGQGKTYRLKSEVPVSGPTI